MENNKKIKPNSYYSIQYWMINELGLKGLELSIYAIIYGFSRDHCGAFTGSRSYLADFTNSTKAEQIINEIARDRTIVEYFTQRFILTYSNVIIAVVGQLTFSEQQLLIKIKNEKWWSILLRYNLKNDNKTH